MFLKKHLILTTNASDKSAGDHHKDRTENFGKSIVEEVLPGPGVEHLDWIRTKSPIDT